MQSVCLICIDGWGISQENSSIGDAIRNAQTPVMTGLARDYPSMELAAHGLHVGLPDGLMGNSEVGHLNIGAGRVVYQDIVRIDLDVENDTLKNNENLKKAFNSLQDGSDLHFIGLVSDGGVHSHIKHLFALLKAARSNEKVTKSPYIHFFGDGRDCSPRSAVSYLEQLIGFLGSKEMDGFGRLATITGRYYAMDRDKRWERVKVAYEALTQGIGQESNDPIATVKERYARDETDEFLKPIIVDKTGIIKDGDVVICFNYRSDRMREISEALGLKPPFECNVIRKDLKLFCMTQYNASFPFPLLYPPQSMENVLAEWLSKHNVPQCHIAETEKYAHVTFFFNGGREDAFAGENRQMIPSPKVATYDLKPEMAAIPVAEAVADVIKSRKYPFVMCNFAPPDMVGHTGVYEAAVKAVEATDKGIGIIYDACKANDYVLFVTADHGNAEKMIGDDGKTPHTAHTTAPVPFIMTSRGRSFVSSLNDGRKGALCDVAPTVLALMNIPTPPEMTGISLLAPPKEAK